MSNKKEILLKNYVAIYRPILAKEKRKEKEERMQNDFKYDLAA